MGGGKKRTFPFLFSSFEGEEGRRRTACSSVAIPKDQEKSEMTALLCAMCIARKGGGNDHRLSLQKNEGGLSLGQKASRTTRNRRRLLVVSEKKGGGAEGSTHDARQRGRGGKKKRLEVHLLEARRRGKEKSGCIPPTMSLGKEKKRPWTARPPKERRSASTRKKKRGLKRRSRWATQKKGKDGWARALLDRKRGEKGEARGTIERSRS